MSRLDKLLSQRGYCSRREARRFLREHEVTFSGEIVTDPSSHVNAESLLIDGEPVVPGVGIVLLLHKPTDVICSHVDDEGETIWGLLPEQFLRRNPPLSTVGRLDKDTSGILLITDDGELLHRLTSPRHHVPKVYDVTLARPLKGDEADLFASGTMLLHDEEKPLKPAALEVLDEHHARLTITEGRYHQVRRMFAAVGNEVTELHRSRIGPLTLGELEPGEYRELDEDEISTLRGGAES